MRKFAKLITASAFALQGQAFAQDVVKGNFSEKNLVDNSPVKSQIVKPSDAPKENPISSTKDIANSIETILLSKQPTSLMFDDEQNSNIEHAIDSFKNNDPSKMIGLGAIDGQDDGYEINEKSRIYLGSILYLTPRDWVVWIGSQKITSFTNNRNNEIYLRAVEKDKIKVVWSMSVTKWKILTGKQSEQSAPKINAKGQVEVEFELKNNQTYSLNTGNIVEGRISIQKTTKDKKKEDKTAAESSTPADSSATSTTPVTTVVPSPDPSAAPANVDQLPVSDNSNATAAPLN